MLDHRYDGVRVSYIMPGSVDTEFGGGPADTKAEWKIAPEDVVRQTLEALEAGQAEVLADPVTHHVHAGLAATPGIYLA